MAASIAVIVIDCDDSQPVAEFWMAALGYEVAARDGTWIKLRDPKGVGPSLAIDPVPEGKIVKNRVHLDLKPSGTVEAEVARLEHLGAQVARVFPGSHVIMQDPEGNEFCVVEPNTLA
ncbi:MAG: VOC family protein [Chloroflexota bacterium]|nr:VOC family protein [Chloroflexota bacterium]